MDKLPPRWRPFARRWAVRELEQRRRVDEGLRFQEFLWELSGHGSRPIPLGTITQGGYQGGMDTELARFLHG